MSIVSLESKDEKNISIMKFQLPQLYFSKLMRAITEFELIEDGDRILIGVSWSKDSIFLAYAMAMMRKRLKKDFELMALTINPMFSKEFDTKRIGAFMAELEIPFTSFEVDNCGNDRGSAGQGSLLYLRLFPPGGGEPLCPGAGLQ